MPTDDPKRLVYSYPPPVGEASPDALPPDATFAERINRAREGMPRVAAG